MSQKKSPASNADKKAQVLNNTQKKNSPLALAAVLGAVVAALVVGGFFIFGGGPAAGPAASAQAAAGQSQLKDGKVYHLASEFADGKARFFKMTVAGNIEVRYFVIKSSDGVIRAAFDACDVCWRSNKGYSQEGDVMVCNNCGRRFPSVKVNEVKGGCNPAPLIREVEGDKLVIKVNDIVKGKRYFDFSQG